MPELKFDSTLSIDEIDNNFRNVDLYARLMESLEDVLLCSNTSDNNDS